MSVMEEHVPKFASAKVFPETPVSHQVSTVLLLYSFSHNPKVVFQMHSSHWANLIRPGHLCNSWRSLLLEWLVPLSRLCGLNLSPSGVAWNKNNYLKSLSLKQEKVALDFSEQDVITGFPC